ncbi:MAG: NACHT domain-containing protein [Leptolyngbyaceae cyanobacterium]
MQQPKIYDWKRFWYPQGTQVKVCDLGYLIDPASEWSKYTNPELVDLEKLASVPCLVLLGEPGIGKSHEIKKLEHYTESLADADSDILSLPLRSCINLRQDLLQNDQFIDWQKGKHDLYLFLDSLDEGLAESKVLANQLVDILGTRTYRKELKRLYIRLACRDAVFPNVLEEGLKDLYGESYAVYKLAHLRSIDIERAATDEGIEAQKFISEVEHKSLTPFSTKPITLRFLFKLYKENEQFSESQTLTDLYLKGCRVLCDEEPDHPRFPGVNENLELDERLLLATRIAAATMLCNRYAVWVGRYSEHSSNKDIDCRELTLGKVREKAIREVLETGLFSRYSFHRIGWAHRTYAEFLAAWYLTKNELDLSQLEGLIFNENRVVPQLSEVTKWLASMRGDFLQKVIKTDANILIKGDLSSFDQNIKSKILDSFLELHQAGKATYRENGEFIYQNSFAHYKQLNYPELPEHLNSYISDPSKNVQSRYVAIDIAEACNLVTIASDLAEIALDENQPYQVRERAARFVANTDNNSAHEKLKDLVTFEQDDPEDDLKGHGLKATYPQYLKTEKVLAHLTPPKASYFGGYYQDFLSHDFTERLPVEDLALTLSWFSKQDVIHDYSYHPFTHLISQLIFKAWENLTDSDVRRCFAQMVIPRMKQYIGIVDDYDEENWKKCIEENNEKRRLLLESIVSIIQDSEKEPLWLCSRNKWSQFYLLSKDFGWLIDKLKTATHEGTKKYIQD